MNKSIFKGYASQIESIENKTTEISGNSTDPQHPTALADCGESRGWASRVGASRCAVYFKVTRGDSYSNTFSPGINLCIIGKWK